MTQPDFILIPTQLLSDEALQPGDRIVFGYIYWMTKLALMKCVASNQTLADMTGMSERGVRGALERLEEQGYVGRVYQDNANRHRVEIVCLLAFSAVKKLDGTNVPSRRNKRAVPVGTNVPHNKKREEEELIRDSTNVLVNSDKPSVTKPKVELFFFMLVKALGFSETVRYTEGRKRKLLARLRTYKGSEILQAATNLGRDAYMQGDNESGKRYGTIDYLLRSDEIVDKYLQVAELKFTEGAF